MVSKSEKPREVLSITVISRPLRVFNLFPYIKHHRQINFIILLNVSLSYKHRQRDLPVYKGVTDKLD